MIFTSGKLCFNDYKFIDTAFGSPKNRNRVISVEELEIPDDIANCFTSMYRFEKGYQEHCKKTGSVSGANNLPCYSDYLWFDIDYAILNVALIEARQLIINIELIDSTLSELVLTFFSGAKGFHIGLPSALFGMEPSKDLPRIHKLLAKMIAKDVSIDTAIYEQNRLWRIPNTKNSKSGLYKIRLTNDQLATLSIEEIKELAKQPLGKPYLCLVGKGEFAPQENLSNLYQQASLELSSPDRVISSKGDPESTLWLPKSLASLSPGNRNETFTRITGKLHQGGFSPEEIKALLQPHAEKCQFPLSELNRQIGGICSRYPVSDPISNFHPIYREKSETESQALKLQSIGELLSVEEVDLTWCVERIFPTESINIIAAPAGHGKSWMLLDLALELVRGGKWLGQFPTTKGAILYVDEENSPRLIRHRIRKLLKAKGIVEDLPGIFFSIGNAISFSESHKIQALRKQIDLCKPSVIIVDSLIRVHRAEENSATEMARVFAVVKSIINDTGCSFIFADHQRKRSKANNSSDQLLRGSTEKLAIADSVLSIQRKDDILSVEHTKCRHAEALRSFSIAIVDTDPEKTATEVKYLGESKNIPKEVKLVEAQKVIYETLDSINWISRKKLLECSKKAGVSSRKMDEALRLLISEQKIERDNRKSETGRGGKSAYYKLLGTSPRQ